MATKQYGLILSQKKKPNKSQQQQTLAAAASVFGKDSDTDDDDDQPVHSKHSGASMQAQRQMRLHVQQAVSDDPTIFQYDELYDDMVSRRKDEEVQQRSAKDQGPKYIKRLLETAEKRKRDYERRVERQVQKERDEEGDKFKDKDSFVTSSYKRKLDEMRAADEEERRNDHRESIADVTKQGNLDGFYRHLFQQRTKEAPTQAPERQYRKRTTGDDTDQPQETPDQLAKVHIDSNLDADSDFSIDSSDDDAETADEPPVKVADSASASEVPVGLASPRSSVEAQDPPERVEVLNVTVDIWKKRTTDASLDEALKRYFERKADRADALY